MKEHFREIVLLLGADVCGFANVADFGDAPDGYRPTDIFPECKTVISFGVALTRGLTMVPPRLIYAHFNTMSCFQVDHIAFQAAKKLEKLYHCAAVPIPCDGPYEYWDEEQLEGRGLLSMKHLAVRAGLGTLGKNSLLLNPSYGNMLTLGCILIDKSLSSDPAAESLCIEGCRKCIDHCPSKSLGGSNVNQMSCREYTYGKTLRGFDTVDCNQCRVVCPVKYGKHQKECNVL